MKMGDIFDAGSEILDAVTDAVDRADFSGLGDSIGDSVRKAFGEDRNRTPAPKKNYFLTRKPPRTDGNSKRLFGILGEVFSGLFALSNLIGVFTGISVGASVTFLILAAFFVWLFTKANKAKKEGERRNALVREFYRYGELVGPGKEFFAVRDLAALAGESETDVRRNIADMKKFGYLPYAMFDRKKTTVMLTSDAYLLYRKADQAREQREEAERLANLKNGIREEAEKETAEASGSNKQGDVSAILSEGESYIRGIREANDQIPDTDPMSDKLYRLERIVRRIFDEVQQHPEKAAGIRKLLRYYLPTTQKLIRAYVDLYRQPQTETIQKTKQQIEDAVDTILAAYARIFDDMFQDEAWDIASDINVMKTVMAQDGLTEDGLQKAKKTQKKQTAAAGDDALDEGMDEGEESESPLHFG